MSMKNRFGKEQANGVSIRFGLIRAIFVIIAAAILVTTLFTACEKTDGGCKHEQTTNKVTVEPTEASEGVYEKTCVACGEKINEKIPKLSAENYELDEQSPSCTENGLRIYRSSYGEFRVVVNKTGHAYETIDTKTATCEENGYVLRKCKVCGYEERGVIYGHGHRYGEGTEIKADCNNDGGTRYVCAECGKVRFDKKEDKKHDFKFRSHTNGTCEETGYNLYVCSACGAQKKESDDKYGHEYVDGKCVKCGSLCPHEAKNGICVECGMDIYERMKKDGYALVDKNGDGKLSAGDGVFFGLFPQTFVSDFDLIAELKKLTPSESGYYELNGKLYARRELNQPSKARVKFSCGEYVENVNRDKNDYFYTVEPLLWRVTREADGKFLLIADKIVACDYYQGNAYYDAKFQNYYINGDNGGSYANSWEKSDIRKFLNENFYENVFDEAQKGFIVSATNNNKDTNYYDDVPYINNEPTEDRVFLAAYKELFGDDEGYDSVSDGRVRGYTDYALGTGLTVEYPFDGTAAYYTRSQGKFGNTVGCVTKSGAYERNQSVSGRNGVLPCLYFSVAKSE